jgi:hypothetical protein
MGKYKKMKKRSLLTISNYLKAQDLKMGHAIVRLDGLYGAPQMASIVQKSQ